ncbi:MAG: 50S ribosomal protein L23 [DPANN group archaeon]|nr:50S ribosomal protein L23 [DPANN group archaeon]
MKIIKHTHMTEKAIGNIELKNELVFIADLKATKEDIKNAVEEMFKIKVAKINVNIDQKGRKKAFIKLKPEFRAMDIATKLGII